MGTEAEGDMLLRRRNPLEQETGREDAQQVAQDGFSAAVRGAARRPMTAAQQAQQAHSAGVRPGPAMGVVGRRVLEFAQNADGTMTVMRCLDMEAEDVDIQFEAGVSSVAAIAPRAFEGCAALKRVILPQGLRMIGERAFTDCVGLEQMVIPGSVTKVGTLAFAKCAGLARVRLEPGVQALGPSCFSKCTGLTRVDMPASVTGFGGGVFFGCGKQLAIYGARGTTAEKYAQFNGIVFDAESYKEDEDLILEEEEDGTLTLMGPRKEKPVAIEIPSEICGRRIARIAPKAFFGCMTLEQVTISSGVKEIGENAFFGCRALVALSFERGLERIGESAFAGCESLTQVTMPWGMGSVGRMAFFGCSSLSFVKMPPTTKVDDMAFDGCAPTLKVFGGVNAGRMASNTGLR